MKNISRKQINYFFILSLYLILTSTVSLQAQNDPWCTELDLFGNASQFQIYTRPDMIIVNGNPAIVFATEDIFNGTTNGTELYYIRAKDAKGIEWNTPIKLVENMAACSGQSLTIVNGNPAIAFHHHQNGSANHSLRYIRANDANGDTWGSVVSVDAGSQTGYYPSLAVIDGTPAIAFFEFNGNDLFYARSTDINGASGWSSTLVDGNNAGNFPTLLEIQGFPAISYYNNNAGTSGHAKYIRATNSSGTSWASAVTLSTGLSIISGRWTEMAIVNGHPAVVFNQNQGGGTEVIRYVRANDNTGNSWPTTTIVETSTPPPGDIYIEFKSYSIAVINGVPAISYFYNYSNWDSFTFDRELRYITSTDANGGTWNTAIEVNDNINILDTHIIEIDSKAAIMYIQSNSSVRYVTQDCSLSSPTSVSIETVAAASSAIENSGTPISYRFTISIPAAATTTINFTISGTAADGDYTVTTGGSGQVTYDASMNKGTIEIAMGATTTDLMIVPNADGITEKNETIIVSVAAP